MVYLVGGNPLIPSEKYKVATVKECLDYFQDIKMIAVDTETKGKDAHVKRILTLQLGTPKDQFVVDCRKVDIKLFKELLETKHLILHNAKFDYKFFKAAGINLNKIWDTMLAECVLYCGYVKYGYGLANLCKRYCDIDMSKETRGDFFKIEDQDFTDSQILYAAKDVEHLHTIGKLQDMKIREYGLSYCVNIENEAVKAFGDIEFNGMFLNSQKWFENAKSYEKDLDAITVKLDEVVLNEPKLAKFVIPLQGNLFGFAERRVNINYASPSQVLEICQLLGFNLESTNDQVISKLVKRDDKGGIISTEHAFFPLLQDFRSTSKIVTTYGENFLNYINSHTGRVHTSFWQVLATGRCSSGSEEDNSPNLQNIPSTNNFRNCFEARPGFKWVSIDYSAQELRLMAEGSSEEGFIDTLNRGEDLHCFVGSMMFKRPITEKDKDLRTKAKTINFGKPYGMGPPKLANQLSIPIQEAEELFEVYGKAFPKLNRWLANQARFAKTMGYSRTFSPCQRIRWYPDIKKAKAMRQEEDKNWREIFKIEGEAERCGMNQPIQGRLSANCPV